MRPDTRRQKSMNTCAVSTSAGRTNVFRRLRAILQELSQFPDAQQRQISKASAMCLRLQNSRITLILCNDSLQRNSGSSSPILTLVTQSSENEPHEIVYWQTDTTRSRADGSAKGDRLHMLPAPVRTPTVSQLRGTPHSIGQPPVGTLVHTATVPA